MLVRQIRRGRKTAGRQDRIAETPWGRKVPPAQGTLAEDQWKGHHTAGISTGTDTHRIRAEESGLMTEIRNSDLRCLSFLALPVLWLVLRVSFEQLFEEPPDFYREAETMSLGQIGP